jgi:hypothetical protein
MPPSHSSHRVTPLSKKLSQWICGLHGHDMQLQIGSGRMRLRCGSCGLDSPGWALGRKPRLEDTSAADPEPPASPAGPISASR